MPGDVRTAGELRSGLRAMHGRAERAGFEPARELAPPTRLAGECLQPLGHLSGDGSIIDAIEPSARSREVRSPPREPARNRPRGAEGALRRDLRQHRAAVRVRRPRRARAQRAADARSGRRAADPDRLEVRALDRGPAPHPRPRSGVLGRARVHRRRRRCTWPTQGFEDLVVAYPSVDRAGDREGGAPRPRGAGARAGADGRRPPPPRPDRGRDRRRARRGPRVPRGRRRLVAARRATASGSGRSARRCTTRDARAGWPRRSPSAPAPSSPG